MLLIIVYCILLMVGDSQSADDCLEGFMDLSLIQLRASRIKVNQPSDIKDMDEEIRIMNSIQFTCTTTQIDSVLLGIDIRRNRDKYPSVQLWRQDDDSFELVAGSERTIVYTPANFSSTGIYEYPLVPPLTASTGDYLAVSQPMQGDSVVRVYTVDNQPMSSYRADKDYLGHTMLEIGDDLPLTNELVLLYPITTQSNCFTSTVTESFIKNQSLLIADTQTVRDDRQFIYPDMKFMCNGTIHKWIYAGTSGTKSDVPELQVWRLVSGHTDTYTKIGYSQVIANETANSKVHEFTVDPPIEFIEGDIFGLFQPNDELFLLYEQKESGPQNYRDDSNIALADITLSSQFTEDNNNYPLVSMEISQFTTVSTISSSTTLSQPTITSISTTGTQYLPTITISITDSNTVQTPILTASSTRVSTDISTRTTASNEHMPPSISNGMESQLPTAMTSSGTISLSTGTSLPSSSNINTTASSAPIINNTAGLAGALTAIGLLIVTIIVCTAIIVVVLIWRKKVEIKRMNDEGIIGKAGGYDDEQTLSNPVYGSGDEPIGRTRYRDIEMMSMTPSSSSMHNGGSSNGATGRAMIPPPALLEQSTEITAGGNAIYSEVTEKVQRFQPNNYNSSFHQQQAADQRYEWSIVVPTLDERRRINSSFKDFRDAVSSQHSEYDSNYHFLNDHSIHGTFFEESNIYWAPGSDYGSLYEQLSSRKFREILSTHVSMSTLLGSGQFGVVMNGTWTSSDGVVPVAIKMVKQDAVEEEKVMFLQEAAIMGQFRHPNIVQIHGVVTMSEPNMIVLELMRDGDLQSYLKGLKPSPGEMVDPSVPELLLSFCRQVASAMEYLSNKSFIHRDLAARNVLVTDKKICKISDFGMSRDLQDETYYISKGGQIPIKWTAPEALSYKKYSTASDVWSYGVLMYEIWSLGCKPWSSTTNQQAFRKVCDGYRLSPPPGCPRPIYELMIKCWHPEYSYRPSFSNLTVELSENDPKLLEVCSSQSTGESHPQSCVLGAPIEAGQDLYTDLQLIYRS